MDPGEPYRGRESWGLDLWSASLLSFLFVGGPAAWLFFKLMANPTSAVTNLYGWGIFVILPMLLGAVATLLYSKGHLMKHSLGVGWLTLLWPTIAVMCFALEGVVCMVMASPILFAATALGSAIASALKKSRHDRPTQNRLMANILILGPAMIYLDASATRPPAHSVVVTSIVIRASADRVWKELHNFDVKDEPSFWLFRHGVAYPLGSHTDGAGIGAHRICRLSTGDMSEVVDGWEPGQRLHFRVLSTPDCMTETTLYGRVQTRHMRGYYECDAGEFRIRPLAGGSVELTGTSWYHQSLYPAAYWELWSDAIVHQVHFRVLEDIRRRAEAFQVSPG